MKRFLLILLLLTGLVLPVAAQMQGSGSLNLLNYDYHRRWRFGFSLGINIFDYSINNSLKEVQPLGSAQPMVLWADVVSVKPGFNINGIVNYRLSHYFDLRALPGICFGTRELNYYNNADGSLQHTMVLESNYAEIPILLKYSAKRTSNYRPYLIGGVNPRFNMNWKTSEKKGNYISTTVFEPFVELGAGLDIYFYYFKLSLQFKFSGSFINSIGSNVVTGQEAYRDAIDRLNSQIFLFTINIE